jgi:hypothetical protein
LTQNSEHEISGSIKIPIVSEVLKSVKLFEVGKQQRVE